MEKMKNTQLRRLKSKVGHEDNAARKLQIEKMITGMSKMFEIKIGSSTIRERQLERLSKCFTPVDESVFQSQSWLLQSKKGGSKKSNL